MVPSFNQAQTTYRLVPDVPTLSIAPIIYPNHAMTLYIESDVRVNSVRAWDGYRPIVIISQPVVPIRLNSPAPVTLKELDFKVPDRSDPIPEYEIDLEKACRNLEKYIMSMSDPKAKGQKGKR